MRRISISVSLFVLALTDCCPKGPAIAALHDVPDRLRRPLRRSGSRWAGVSSNDLTDEQRIDTLSGVAAFSGVPVAVEAVSPPRSIR